jgi:hypothetical protein
MRNHHGLSVSLVLSAAEIEAAGVRTYEGDDDMPGTHIVVDIGALALQPAVDEELPELLRELADRVERDSLWLRTAR